MTELRSFFDAASQAELRERALALRADSPRQWGSMDPAQMLAHCTAALRMSLGELPVKTSYVALIGWLFKGVITRPQPFQHNLPTAPELTMAEPKAFEAERARFLAAFTQLCAGPEAIRERRHPFFGSLNDTQWGILTYRHLDHHFRQFGV